MGKFFNVDGVCRAKEHFMMDVSERANSICKMVDNGDYFCVNSGRLFGKSTLLRMVADMLSDKYLVFRISLKNVEEKFFEEERKFGALFMESFFKSSVFIPVPGLEKRLRKSFNIRIVESLPLREIPFLFERILNKLDKPAVLLIDGIDRIVNFHYWGDFIKIFSSMFIQRESRMGFNSVIFAGVNDLRNFSFEIVLGKSYKPWEIAVPLELSFDFSSSEISNMLLDFKQSNSLSFDEKSISESIFAYTSGQPFLVSSLCKIIVGEELSWDKIGVETAVDIFIEGTNPYFDNIVSDLKYYPELNDLLRSVIVDDSEIDFEASNKCIKIASMLKYIIDKNGKVCIANKIWEEFLYDYFLGDSNPYQVDGADKVLSNVPEIKFALEQFSDKNEIPVTSSPKNILSRAELVERLKAIAEDDSPREERLGAMCYSPIFNRIKIRLKCEYCGANIDVYEDYAHINIISKLRSIKSLGYDAKVEIICEDCARKFAERNNLTIKDSYYDFNFKKDYVLSDINYLFYFRLSDESDYHCVIDNRYYHYKSLLTFLENKKMYLGYQDESHYLADEIDVIEFMTGLKLNE